MKTVLEGKKENGERFSKEVEIERTMLNLNDNQLASIDLSPLKQFTQLQELYLCGNQLVSIDLSPLIQCPRLQTLDLSLNRLTSIDLSPLAQCPRLETLDLSANQFASIDLSPLKQYIQLQRLDLSFNQLTSIDLSPLAHCLGLQWLRLSANQLASIDLSPLKECTQLQELYLDSVATILWNSSSLDLVKLPKALQEYRERIKRVHEQYLKQEQELGLRKIIRNYSKISLDIMTQLLKVKDTLALQQWIINFPGEQIFFIEEDKVIIPEELKSGTVEAEAEIEKIIKELERLRGQEQ